MLLEADDHELVLQCKEGDGREDAFRLLLAKYEGYVYSLCHRSTDRREDALELAQDTWLRVFAGLSGFQVNRPFKPWLRKITINVCLNFLRRAHPEILSLENCPAPAAPEWDDPATLVQWTETSRLLREAVERLPPLHRLILTLRHAEEMTYEQIADVTGFPLSMVKTYLFRARRSLRRTLAGAYGWEVTNG